MPTYPQQLLPDGWQVVKRSVPGRYANSPRQSEWWLQRRVSRFPSDIEPDTIQGRADRQFWADVSGPFARRSYAIDSYMRMHRGAVLAGPMPAADEEDDGDAEAAPAEPQAPPDEDYDDC